MFKFNGGRGAIICNKCRVIIAEDVAPTPHNQRPIFCVDCKKEGAKIVTPSYAMRNFISFEVQKKASYNKVDACLFSDIRAALFEMPDDVLQKRVGGNVDREAFEKELATLIRQYGLYYPVNDSLK